MLSDSCYSCCLCCGVFVCCGYCYLLVECLPFHICYFSPVSCLVYFPVSSFNSLVKLQIFSVCCLSHGSVSVSCCFLPLLSDSVVLWTFLFCPVVLPRYLFGGMGIMVPANTCAPLRVKERVTRAEKPSLSLFPTLPM